MKQISKTSRTTRASVAAAVVLLLAACGARRETTDAGTPSPQPRVLHLGRSAATGGNGATAMAAARGAAPVASPEAVTGDRMIAPYVSYDFVVSGDLPSLDGQARSWYYPGNSQASMDGIKRVADAFGVDGEPVALTDEQGGGWRIGPDDGTAASLWVSGTGTIDWYYSPAWDDSPGGVIECVVPMDDASGVPTAENDVCEEPTPPEGVPSAEEARAKAVELFSAAGVDTSGRVEVQADEWGAWVTIWQIFEGYELPMAASMGFGANGTVTSASAFLGVLVAGDEYPRMGTSAALERLRTQQDHWLMAARGSVDSDLAALGACPVPSDDVTRASDEGNVDGSDAMPMPVDCAEIEPVTITLTGVRDDLTMVWDVDNTVWLLPAYSFTSDDGGVWTVIAVDDSFIEFGEPLPVEPLPVESLPVESLPVEPAPVESLPVDTRPTDTAPADTERAAGAVGDVPGELSLAELGTLVGLSDADAREVARSNGWDYRVVNLDGEPLPATADYSPRRANVSVVDGVVTAATAG